MMLELFVHIAHLEDLKKGRPVNCKINYASQYDVKILVDPNKYHIISSQNSNNQNLVTVKKKRLFRK